MGKLSAVCMVVVVGCATGGASSGAPADFAFTELERQVHDLVNAHRDGAGLPPLGLDPVIGVEARGHSRAMLEGEVEFGHAGFDARVRRIRREIDVVGAAENVASNQGYADPAATAVDGWIASAGHLENIEGPFDRTGIGVAEGPADAYLFTQIFVLSR